MRHRSEFKRKLRKEIGARLAQLRESLNLPRTKISGMIDIDRASIQRYEEGQYFPEISTLATLSGVFGVSLDWLVVNRGPMYYKEKIAETGENERDRLLMREEYRDLLDNMEKYPVLRYEVLLQVQKFLESKQGQSVPSVGQPEEQES
jgi:transcriptional regulator with XRE-family HTH domain